MKKIITASIAILSLGVAGSASAAFTPQPMGDTIVKVVGTPNAGFTLTFANGFTTSVIPLPKAVAECRSEYRNAPIRRARCVTFQRTHYAGLGEIKKTIAYLKANPS